MFSVLVKNGSDVLSKRVYGGAITQEMLDAEIARLELAYPSYTFTQYEDTDVEFTSAVVNVVADII